jgi:low temperature requirement protein LtrA
MVSSLAVGITAALWWLYFYRLKDRLEHAMASSIGAAQSTMARDMFSLFHFPMICGLIIYAYAIEEAMMHPADIFPIQGRLALASGISLYSLSIVLAYWRATNSLLYLRIVFTILIAGISLAYPGTGVLLTLSICFAGLLVLCILEETREKEEKY